ncbi:MAG: AAA family ATPase [Actinobacteria bacterium]|nr:AAA family ATPase [Actinomycetota bacterium]
MSAHAAEHSGSAAPAAARRERELATERERVAALYARLDHLLERTRKDLRRTQREQTAGTPAAVTEQEAFVRLYTERLEALAAAQTRLCFGRLDLNDGTVRYIGRVGLADDDQQPLLTDWRAPAAEPFYQATSALPRGVVRRRHIVTEGREVSALEDDVLDLEALAEGGAGIGADDVQGGGVLMAALAARRTGRMHDIVATMQAEQDAIVRSPLPGMLVVEGGPGCGKTVVALHRAAYLLYTHREKLSRSGVLIVGPNRIFLHYIGQVLPALGETSAVLATPGQLYPGVDARAWEPDEIAVLKGSSRMADVITRAVRMRQRTPDGPRTLAVGSARVVMTPDMVAAARDRARATRRPHNVARRTFALTLLETLAQALAHETRVDLDNHRDVLISDLRDSRDVRREVNLAWMPLTPEQVIADLWARPDLLAAAAPHLRPDQRELLQRDRGAPWTPADVPLLDEAAEALGVDDEAERLAQAHASADRRAEMDYAQSVLEMTGTRGVSADQLIDRYATAGESISLADRAADDREWVYGHVVVDEAQELSPMAWRLLARRCPSLSMTVVGDLDQSSSSAGPATWSQALGDIAKARPGGEQRWRVERLTVNYRTPRPFMELAQDVMRALGREPSQVESIRDGVPPVLARLVGIDDVASLVKDIVVDPDLGRLGVITAPSLVGRVEEALRGVLPAGFVGDGDARLDAPVVVLTVQQAKGLEFDIVVVAEPGLIELESPRPGSDLYVALTRATRELIVAYTGDLPRVLETSAAAVA